MILNEDPIKEFNHLAYQFGTFPNEKIILNKNFLPYYEDLLPKIANKYKELEIKCLDENIFFYNIIIEEGL